MISSERLVRLADGTAGGSAARRGVSALAVSDLPAQVQVMLTGMGFGNSVSPSGELRMPVHLSLALGVCAGLAAVTIGAGVWRLMTP